MPAICYNLLWTLFIPGGGIYEIIFETLKVDIQCDYNTNNLLLCLDF